MPTVPTGSSYVLQLLLMAAVVLLPEHAVAAKIQTASNTPESVVLVLKLVSSTHVRPTTGVVISDDGLVLVTADFVAAGDEIVILQGGNDIIRNGRPSRTVKRSAADGLAVLAADGLTRPGIIRSEDSLSQEQVYHLSAFPPAEKMADGAGPLWLPVKLLRSATNGGFGVSAETPLPNTSGPIIDHCGYLVGLNLATGGQDESPVTLLGDELSVVFDAMEIDIPGSICRKPALSEQAREQSTTLEPATADVQKDIDQELEKTAGAAVSATLVRQENDVNTPWVLSIAPLWLWGLGIAILIALLAKFSFSRRLARHDPQHTVKEPNTVPLTSAAVTTTNPQRTRLADTGELPDVGTLPDSFDGSVVIEGLLGDNTPCKYSCAVNTEQINVVIGQGEVDISIETATISHRHVRLENVGALLTICDLGSGKGTFIRGIPCLPNEVMMIGPEDEICLGDVRCYISLQTGSQQTGHGDPE